MHHRHTWILIGILLFASWIRLHQSSVYIPFWQEQVDDLLSVRSIWTDITTGNFHHLSAKGQTGTYRWTLLHNKENPIYHGVAYYYLLLPAAVISHFDPYGVVLFLVALGVATVYLLYRAGELLFGDEYVGLVAAYMGAVSFWLASYSRWIWTPSTIPFFSVLSLVAFLEVYRGNRAWWYALVFSLSFGSQVHTSGYIPLIFFGGLVLWYRPSLPKGLFPRMLLVALGVIPILPSVFYEVSSGLSMTKALLVVFFPAASQSNIVGSMSGFVVACIQNIIAYIFDAFGFTVARFGDIVQYRDTLLFLANRYPLLYIVGLGFFIGFLLKIIFVKRKSLHWQWIALWWLIFLPIPWLVAQVYLDETINEYSRMNNLVFAFPLLLLVAARAIVTLWKTKMWLVRIVVVIALVVYTLANMSGINNFLFHYKETTWAYKEMQYVARVVPKIAAGRPYDLRIYRFNEGSFENLRVYEPLYFMVLHHYRLPEVFNGQTSWGITGEPLAGGKAGITIIVMERAYVSPKTVPDSAVLVAQTLSYNIYQD